MGAKKGKNKGEEKQEGGLEREGIKTITLKLFASVDRISIWLGGLFSTI